MTTIANYNDVLAVYGRYAAAIRPYLLHTDAHPEIRPLLGDAVRVAFIDLVARTNIRDPLRPIKVRVDFTARRLGLSEKSVSRAINIMLENGWLHADPAHDGRDNKGKYAGRRFIVTGAFRKLIGMPTDDASTPGPNETPDETLPPNFGHPGEHAQVTTPSKHDASAPDDGASHQGAGPDGFNNVSKALGIVERLGAQRTGLSVNPQTSVEVIHMAGAESTIKDETSTEKSADRTELSDGPIYAVNKVFLKKEASLQTEASDEKSKNPKNPFVPASLHQMQQELGISSEGMCSLMALAKQTGQWLQDVWKAKRDTLLNSGAKNGRAVKYLRWLLNCGEDFSYVARTKIVTQEPGQASADSQSTNDRAPSPAPQAGQDDAWRDEAGRPAGGLSAIIDEVAKACRFKKFRHVTKSLWVRFFDGIAEVSDGMNTVVYAGSTQMHGLYFGIARGNLVEIVE
jgi:hypothetical protein